MLKGEFYTLTQTEKSESQFKALVELNIEHPIFKGHFPGQPIVPGVCMMQIIQETVTDIIGKPLQLKKGDILKFLSMINPLETSKVHLDLKYIIIEDGSVKVDAQLVNAETIYFKFKGTFGLD